MNDEIDNDFNDETEYESIDTKDDTEDELVNIRNYIKIIESLTQYNNNVYLSATIDKTNNFKVIIN